MDSIYSFLSGCMNFIIVVMGLALIFFIVGNWMALNNHYKQIKNVMNWKNTKTVFNKKTHEVEDLSAEEKVTPDTIRELQTAFNRTCSWHEAFAQLIPIFPLLGILGTVAGIILQLSSQDLNQVFNSLHLALGSTFWGLIVSIILKIIDALLSVRIINETEIILDDYEKKVDNAIRLGNISE